MLKSYPRNTVFHVETFLGGERTVAREKKEVVGQQIVIWRTPYTTKLRIQLDSMKKSSGKRLLN